MKEERSVSSSLTTLNIDALCIQDGCHLNLIYQYSITYTGITMGFFGDT